MDRFYKSILFIAFIVLMAAVLDFRVSLIINLPMFLYVLVGTTLLTFFYRKKGQDRYHLMVRIRLNLLMTGVLVMFLSQVISVATVEDYRYIAAMIIHNFLPLFYAMLMVFIVDLFPYEEPTAEPIRPLVNDRLALSDLKLTKRERMVAQILFEDRTNKEIGQDLSISENTVKKHVHNIYDKAGVKNRTEFIHTYYLGGGE